MDKKEVIANAIHRIDVEDYDRQSSIEQMYNDVVEKACEWLRKNFNQVLRKFDDGEVIRELFTDEVESRFKQAMEE